MITTNESELQERYARLKEEKSNIRIRDAARELGVSEVELVALNCGTPIATRLRGPWGEFVKKLSTLGRCMALTRNEAAVHERKGTYENIEIFGPMGTVLGADIDLRLFLMHWHVGFALREEVEGEMRRSLQIFDKHGVAIHKIYPQDAASEAAFEKIVAEFVDENQAPQQTVEPEPAAAIDPPDAEIDVEAFRTTWDGLKDTHEFHGMVRKFKVGRVQALRLAGEDRAYRVKPQAAREVLERAAASGMRIMVFVGNRGMIQIHSGPVKNIKIMGPWLNVLDPDFNLHLREDMIDKAFVVKKATSDGQITSLELYDPAGENIALFFGKRQPKENEQPAWRELAESLPKN
jgi:putative hemin transport protein